MSNIKIDKNSVKNLIDSIDISIHWMARIENDSAETWEVQNNARAHRKHLEYIKEELWRAL